MNTIPENHLLLSNQSGEWLAWFTEQVLTDVALTLVALLLVLMLSKARSEKGIFPHRAKPTQRTVKHSKEVNAPDQHGALLGRRGCAGQRGSGALKPIKVLMNGGRIEEAMDVAVEAFAEKVISAQAIAAQLFRNVDSGEQALYVLQQLLAKGHGQHSTVFNCALNACATHGSKQAGQAMLEMMKELQDPCCKPDEVSYNTLLKVYVEAEDLFDAPGTLTEMRDAGLQPQDHVYHKLIHAAITMGNFQMAWDVLHCMDGHGVATNKYTLCIMMKALRQRTRRRPLHSSHAKRVFELVENSGVGIASDEVLLATFVEACIWHREHQRLEQALLEFRKSTLQPNTATFAVLIRGAKDLKRLDWCWEFWCFSTQTKGNKPNQIMLGCMVDALICCRDVAAAIKLFNEWKDQLPPNLVICSTLAKGLLACGRVDEAIGLWQSTREQGIQMNVQFYNMIIECHATAGRMEGVHMLHKEMLGDGLEPDAITMTAMAKGHITCGDLEQALDLVLALPKSGEGGVKLDLVFFNLLLDGCYKHNRPELVDMILQAIKDHHIRPTGFALGIISKLLRMNGQFAKANKIMEHYGAPVPRSGAGAFMHHGAHGVLPGPLTDHSSVALAEEAFLELLEMQGAADGRRFGAIITTLVQCQYLDRAVKIVELAYGLSGQVPRLLTGDRIQDMALNKLLSALRRDPSALEKVSSEVLEKLDVSNHDNDNAVDIGPIHSRRLPKCLPENQPGHRGKTSPEEETPEKPWRSQAQAQSVYIQSGKHSSESQEPPPTMAAPKQSVIPEALRDFVEQSNRSNAPAMTGAMNGMQSRRHANFF